MKPRLDYAAAAPQVMKGMYELEKQVRSSGLEHSLIELVKMRASQINGCAFCLHMHSRDARAAGETEERLYLLDAWRESPLYTARERAALAWTESLTLISKTHAPDADYEEMASQFAPDEQVKLTLLICAINAWNRIAIGFRSLHPVAETAGATAKAKPKAASS